MTFDLIQETRSDFMRSRVTLGLLIVTSLVSASSLLAQAQYSFYGIVRQPDGSLAPGATVNISGPSGMTRQAFADDMGRYEISGLARGQYHIIAANPADPNQIMESVEVDTSQFVGARIMINLYLRYASQVETPKKNTSGIVSLAEEAEHVPKPAQKAFDKAIELRGKKKLDAALASFTEAIRIFPGYFRALAERGHLLIAMQRPSEARKDFDRALELNPRFGPALRGEGMCEFQQGKFVDAVQTLTKAEEAEPGNATNYLFVGIADVALDRRDQARSALLKALSIDPVGSVRAHVHLASLLIKDGQPHEAIHEIEAYLAAVPKAPDAGQLRKVLDQLRAQTSKR